MARLEIRLLGPLQVTLGEERITKFRADTARALLAYLALHSRTAWPRDALAGLLWPDQPDAEARRNLRVALRRLRVAIRDQEANPPFLLVDRQTIQLNLESEHTVDARVFEEAVAATKVHRHRRLERCDVCARRLQEAAELYRGDMLSGFYLPSAPYEEWMLVERESLHQPALEVFASLAAYHEGRQEYEPAIAYARRQIELEPWREVAHRQCMRALAASGQRAAALTQYQACKEILAEELGVEPEPETLRLYERIRDGAEVQPVSPTRPHNLPAQLTSFVGRKPLLAQIAEVLLDPDCRLLTLVGPGGSGKTRLALQTARELVSSSEADLFVDGVFLVSLAPLQSSQSIVPAIAQALGLSFEGVGDPVQQLLGYLRRRGLLLVLDNVEHLLVSAPGAAEDRVSSPMRPATGARELVTELLRTASQVKVLVTSRIALNVESEQLLPIPGMRYPQASPQAIADIDQYSAVRLFLDRAHHARPGYEAGAEDLAGIAEVCRLVQGMPLGILLAAAWIKVLPPHEIAAEIRSSLDFLEADLRDLPARQRGMRAVYDYSWSLLSERERKVCAGVSVFRGGFTREAADQVVGASLRDLMALVDRSLLNRSPAGRYEMHELLRQYAGEQLDRLPEASAAVRDRCAAYYAAACERWEADLKGPRQLVALAEFEADLDNARAAWEWGVEQRHVERLGQAVDGLALLHEWRGRYREMVALCGAAADALTTLSLRTRHSERVLARVLAWQGFCAEEMGDIEAARRWVRESLAILEQFEHGGEPNDSVDCRSERALALWAQGLSTWQEDPERTRQAFEQSLALYQAIGDRWCVGRTLYYAAGIARWSRQWSRSEELARQCLALIQSLGDRRMAAATMVERGMVARAQGRLEEAECLARESLRGAEEARDWKQIALAAHQLDEVRILRGEFAMVRVSAERRMAYAEELGNRTRFAEALLTLSSNALHAGEYERANTLAQAMLDECLKGDYVQYAVYSYDLLGRVALARGDYVEARRLMVEAGDYGLDGLALAERAGGESREAERHLSLKLCADVGQRHYWETLGTLTEGTLFLVDRGQIEWAVEIYALALCYPLGAKSKWFEDIVGSEITAAASVLPPDVVAAAQERGRTRDLWTTAEELLAELEGCTAGETRSRLEP